MISARKKVHLSFELTTDGRLVRVVHPGRPISFIQGKKTADVPTALQKQLMGLKVGERKTVRLKAAEGFGPHVKSLVMTMPRSRFAQRYHFIGREILSEKDNKHLAVVKEVHKDKLVVDFNHPLAGKELCYRVLIISIEGEGAMSYSTLKKI